MDTVNAGARLPVFAVNTQRIEAGEVRLKAAVSSFQKRGVYFTGLRYYYTKQAIGCTHPNAIVFIIITSVQCRRV